MSCVPPSKNSRTTLNNICLQVATFTLPPMQYFSLVSVLFYLSCGEYFCFHRNGELSGDFLAHLKEGARYCLLWRIFRSILPHPPDNSSFLWVKATSVIPSLVTISMFQGCRYLLSIHSVFEQHRLMSDVATKVSTFLRLPAPQRNENWSVTCKSAALNTGRQYICFLFNFVLSFNCVCLCYSVLWFVGLHCVQAFVAGIPPNELKVNLTFFI